MPWGDGKETPCNVQWNGRKGTLGCCIEWEEIRKIMLRCYGALQSVCKMAAFMVLCSDRDVICCE